VPGAKERPLEARFRDPSLEMIRPAEINHLISFLSRAKTEASTNVYL